MKNKLFIIKKLGIILIFITIAFNLFNKKYDSFNSNIVLETSHLNQNNKIIKIDKIEDNTQNKSEIFNKEKSEKNNNEVTFVFMPLTQAIKDKINGTSFKEDGLISYGDLSYIKVTYWGFDEKTHIGELIVNKELAEEVVGIFEELYEIKYPIEKIRLIDEYNADDDLSMVDNNTSAFNYREVTEKKGTLSKHSYGIAIDINPVQNPYIKGSIVLPNIGIEYIDRSIIKKGMIIQGDPIVEAFTSRGWIWGGDWENLKDYQHFEKNIN